MRSNLDFDNLNKSCSQGNFLNNDHHPELQEVEFPPPPEKRILEIIDVDADVPVQDEPGVDAEVSV